MLRVPVEGAPAYHRGRALHVLTGAGERKRHDDDIKRITGHRNCRDRWGSPTQPESPKSRHARLRRMALPCGPGRHFPPIRRLGYRRSEPQFVANFLRKSRLTLAGNLASHRIAIILPLLPYSKGTLPNARFAQFSLVAGVRAVAKCPSAG